MRFPTRQKWQTIALLFIFFALNCGAENIEKTFVKTANFALTTSFNTITSSSKMRCVDACAKDRKCFSATYSFSTGECRMSVLPLFAILNIVASGAPNNGAVTFSMDEWFLVFRGTPAIGVDAQIAWLNGISVTASDVTCQELNVTSCAQHYRHPVVDSWNTVGVKQVKIAFYKGNMEKYIIFNGIGSDISNWFQQSRVLDSSWPTLAGDTYRHFSIEGDNMRHFFTSRAYSGCASDTQYTLVLNGQEGPNRCDYDMQTAYPQFLFATGLGPGQPESMTGMDYADLFAIFIK